MSKVIVCPYCMVLNQLDPPLLCCGEVHAQEAWENEEGEIILENGLLFEIEKLEKENKKLREMLVNEWGACPDCIDAKLEGYTICGECSVPYCHICNVMAKKDCKCNATNE